LLKNAGVKIKAAIGLHTKLYLFDNNILILGSSNFTDGGFTNNTELNLLIEDEEKILAAASKYYDELSDAIDDCYILSDAKIDEESEFQNSLGLSSRGYNRDFQRSFDFGAKLKSKRKSDLIEEILSVENESYIEESDSWLKFEGLVESRLPKTEKIIRNKVNGIYKTNFPRRPRGIKEGDTIILAALSYNSQDRPMPVIFGYAWTDGYKKDYVHSKEEIEERPILERFPYYIDLYDLRSIDSEAQNCVPMSELYATIGSNLFPSTKNKIIGSDKLQQMHYRRDKMKVTKEAKEYLVDQINKKIKEYGAI